LYPAGLAVGAVSGPIKQSIVGIAPTDLLLGWEPAVVVMLSSIGLAG